MSILGCDLPAFNTYTVAPAIGRAEESSTEADKVSVCRAMAGIANTIRNRTLKDFISVRFSSGMQT